MSEVARDTTWDNIGAPKTGWITVSNCGENKDQLEIILEINGTKKVIQSHYIPGLSRDEGITLHSTNLSWLFTR